jgi:hypothetical protein
VNFLKGEKMKQLIKKEAQKESLNSNWLTVAVLVLCFVFPAVPEETAQESQQPDPNAPSKIIRGYKVDTSRKDDEGNFVRTPVYADPNEVPPPAKPAAKPSAISSTFTAKLQKASAYIGPEIYSFKYKEPGIMEEEGIFYGIHFGCTSREWISAPPKNSSKGGGMFRAEGRLAFGQVDYDGGLGDLDTGEIYPYSINNINDLVFEGRFLLGADMLIRDTLGTIYSGIGYRYLNDDPSFDPYSYERESNYLYIPLGSEIYTSFKADWYWGARIEFDYLLWGMQRSHLSDIGYYDVDNRQNSGYGYRASVRFEHKSNDAVFAIEPFFRYWDIDDSEVEYAGYGFYGLEPANETKEIGIQLFWIF